jgi:2-keto-4-pentenoate hydratase/2-oxohepta-3-ene-1,7-dioic acid hydratase in catechol pathway
MEGGEVHLLRGNPFAKLKEGEGRLGLSQARLLAPVLPGKALCIGLNYRDHAKEFDLPIPTSPVVFIKPPSALLAPGAEIINADPIPTGGFRGRAGRRHSRRAKDVRRKKAIDYILGYTCGNDVTARDLQPKTDSGRWPSPSIPSCPWDPDRNRADPPIWLCRPI